MNVFKIDNRKIGLESPPYIIAEMSGNHNQSLEQALQIVEHAANAGADALKIQTYTPDTLTIDSIKPDFQIQGKKSLWRGESLYSLYQKAYTPWEWHEKIFDRCRELGITGFSTAFDETAVDFLEDLNVPAYKIASFENNHLPLIKKIAATKKPIIVSTGMATLSELDELVATIRSVGNEQLILLKCTSGYPASAKQINLRTIPHLRTLFDVPVGLSDHTHGINISLASIAFGSVVIEKHVTLSRADGGVDSAFSLEPEELKSLVTESLSTWEAMGRVFYGQTDQEKESMQFRRSIYVVKNMKKGELFTSDNLRIIRPGHGLHPRYYEKILGKQAIMDLEEGWAMSQDYF